LKKIANGSLDHLANLRYLFFDHNVCINLRNEGKENMDKIMLKIYNKCEGKNAELKPSEIDICNPIKCGKSYDIVITEIEEDIFNKSDSNRLICNVKKTIAIVLLLYVYVFRF
jgi:hypothetical protein